MNDSWRPREHDHLVEPVFGGLGVEPPSGGGGRWARLLSWLRALFGGRRRA